MKMPILAFLAAAALVGVGGSGRTTLQEGTVRPATTVLERLVGAGSSFGIGSATASGTIAGQPFAGGTYSAAIATDWSQATTEENGNSCAPATATLSLVDAASSAVGLGETVTGKTCALPTNDGDRSYVFFDAAVVSGATGARAGAAGTWRVALLEATDGTVNGVAVSGSRG